MNRPGILLDTGPLVALLSKDDRNHDRARRLFADSAAPFRCCEAVVAEACFLKVTEERREEFFPSLALYSDVVTAHAHPRLGERSNQPGPDRSLMI